MSSVIPLHSPRAGAVPSVASQQAIENALSMALYYMRQPSARLQYRPLQPAQTVP